MQFCTQHYQMRNCVYLNPHHMYTFFRNICSVCIRISSKLEWFVNIFIPLFVYLLYLLIFFVMNIFTIVFFQHWLLILWLSFIFTIFWLSFSQVFIIFWAVVLYLEAFITEDTKLFINQPECGDSACINVIHYFSCYHTIYLCILVTPLRNNSHFKNRDDVLTKKYCILEAHTTPRSQLCLDQLWTV